MLSKEKNNSVMLYYIHSFLLNGRFSRGVLLLYCLNLGMSLLEFGTIQSCYFLVKLLLEMPSGIIADRCKKKYVIAIGTAICSLSSLLLFLLPFTGIVFFPALIFLFSLDSLGGALISGTDQSVLYEYLQFHDRENEFIKVLSNAQIIGLFVLALATAAGGKIYSWGFSIVFLLQASFYFIAIFPILFMEDYEAAKEENNGKKTKQSIREQLKSLWQCLRNNVIISYLILFMTLLEVYANFLMSFIQGAFSKVGITDSAISIIIGAVTFIGILGAYMSRFFKNLSFSYFILLFTILFMIGCGLLSLNYAIFLIVGFFLINILVDAAQPYISHGLNSHLEDSVCSSVLSIFSTIVSLISLSTYPILGWLLDNTGYSLAFISIGGLFFSFMLILFFYSSQTKITE